MERAAIHDAVVGVAGGRAKRRRLAQALLERPAVLADGRSPAPRVVGDLLIALRACGALQVSPPTCAACSKALRTLQRRGESWYCAACGPRRERCAACDQTRPVSVRDRDGRPRCVGCPPEHGRDPLDIAVTVVTGVDPTLSAEVVIGAVSGATTTQGQRRQLAWALEDRPELLTGAGAETPVPSVLRLIDRLCDAGASLVVRPACPHCRRVIPLVKPRDGVRLCRSCVARSRAEPCARCRAVREPAARDSHGGPICPTCWIRDPANHETCSRCGRRRPVSARTPDGVLCETCRPWKVLTCAICGRHGPCLISETTTTPWCRTCTRRWARCFGCGEVAQVRGGTINEPCARPAHGRTPSSGRPARAAGSRGASTPAAAAAAQWTGACVSFSATTPAPSTHSTKLSTRPSPPLSDPPRWRPGSTRAPPRRS